MSKITMQKVFTVVGWLLIAGGLVGSVVTYAFINSQDFVVALLARVVEQPFEYRTYIASLAAAGVALCACLTGAIFVGLAEILHRGNPDSRSAD
jgi:hypothetical protein